MQGYSLGGFVNAVLRRSGKTLLVEGVYDQSLLNRLKLENAAPFAGLPRGQLDCAQMIQDPAVAGLGNKARIGAIRAHMNSLATPFKERVGIKFGTLVDREWDGLDIDMQLKAPWAPPTQEVSAFTTLGHSIENYFFNASGANAYLRMFFSDKLPAQFFEDLSSRFHQTIALAIAYSLALRKLNSLTRSDGLIARDHVQWDGGRYHVTANLATALGGRGVAVPADFLHSVNTNIDLYLAENTTEEPGRWICHGHLGQQAIWSCIANLAEERGTDNDVLQMIERGSRENRFRHSADCLCRGEPQHRAPLDDALNWLHT